jgi:hypothetical protein
MAKIKPIYEELPEFTDIVKKLIDLYPSNFPNIDAKCIAAVQITNKSRPEKKKQVWELRPVVPPITLFCDKLYFVTLFADDWAGFSEKHRAAIVADVLMSISPDGEGKTVPFDMKDHSVILRTLGVDYMETADIPDLMSGKVTWRN